MDRSAFGSTIKTYPSKTNRFSRTYTYRSSVMASSAFGNAESDELFDKLLSEEKQKRDITKANIADEENCKSNRNKCSTTLKNIQNVGCDDTRRKSQISVQRPK